MDDDGNWRGGGYLSLLCPPDHQDARHDGECGALFYLGMANVVMSPHRIRVRWSVQDVHPNTLRSINDLLESLEAPPRIVLEYYFGGWERRYFSSVALAVQCLKSAMRFRDTEPMIKPFVRRMPLNHENALPMFRKFLERWELGGGRFSTTRETTLSPVNERLLALTPRGGDDRLIYSHLGAQAALTRFKGP
ncbi:MAG: hypothetical protein OXR84_08255 [Magnetovibrio sp.]|nr:hypothetical protein [Magnetovibrio sp.]